MGPLDSNRIIIATNMNSGLRQSTNIPVTMMSKARLMIGNFTEGRIALYFMIQSYLLPQVEK